MNDLSLEACLGTMKLLVEGGACDNLDRLGIQPEIMDRVRTFEPLQPEMKLLTLEVVNAMIWGMLDLNQIPRIQVSAETMAAAILITVRPVNVMKVCAWCEGYYPAEDIAQSTDTLNPGTKVTGMQLYAMCQFMNSHEGIRRMSHQFSKIVDKRINDKLGIMDKIKDIEDVK